MTQHLYYALLDIENFETKVKPKYVVMVSETVANWLNANYIVDRDYYWVGGPGNSTSVTVTEEVYLMMGLKWT